MSAFLDFLEYELGAFVDTMLERTWDDDGTVPSRNIEHAQTRRIGDAVLWRFPFADSALYGLYEAFPAKHRIPATIALERVRLVVWGKFNASYHFDSWRLSKYGSLKLNGFYPRLELARVFYAKSGHDPAWRAKLDAALIEDNDPDRALYMAGL